MKKNAMFITLILISALSFAQTRTNSTFKAVKSAIKGQNPSNAKSIIDSLHYDNDNFDAIGTNDTISFGVYMCIPASHSAAHHSVGNSITSVKVFINDTMYVTNAEIKIFSDTGITLLATKTFIAHSGWNDVLLTSPLTIPASDMYIGYNIQTTAGYPAGIDSAYTANANANANWIIDEGDWKHLTDLNHNLTGSWNIRAMVDGTALTTPLPYFSPSNYSFESVVVGYNQTSSDFTLENVGGGTLEISDISGLSEPYTTTLNPADISLTAGQSASFTFKFTPTVGGQINQNVTINTNVGPVTFSLTGIGVVCEPISQFPWHEDFESGVIPTCWHKTDADGDGYNWNILSTNHLSHSGTYSAVSASWDIDPLTPDNFLITPKIAVNDADLKLHYWAATQDISYPLEHYSVMISTTGTEPVDFSEIFNETLSDTVFNSRTISLEPYNGQEVYIAFRHWNCTDNFEMKLDDISIDLSSGIDDPKESNPISVFPNPAKNRIFVNASKINSIEIFNLTGVKIASFDNQNTMDVSLFPQGTYLVKIISNNNVTTKKINIVR